MGGEIDGVRDFGAARRLDACDIGVGPDDLRAVSAVELFDALTRVTGDLAKRVNRIRQDARQHLHPIVGRARLVGETMTPATDHWPYPLGPIKLRDAEAAEIFIDAIEPRGPVALSRAG